MVKFVDFFGGNVGFDERFDVIENFGGEMFGNVYFFDFFWGFDSDVYGGFIGCMGGGKDKGWILFCKVGCLVNGIFGSFFCDRGIDEYFFVG